MKSNFEFLNRYWPALSQIGANAENYLYSDPNACIYKIGMFAERLVQEMLVFENMPEPETDNTHVFRMIDGKCYQSASDTYNRSLDEIMEEQMQVSMRPQEFVDLEEEFRNAVIHNRKDLVLAKLEQIREILGEDDPFFITARIVMERMK